MNIGDKRPNFAFYPATCERDREAAVALLPFLLLRVNYLTLLDRLLTDAAERGSWAAK